MGAKFGEQGRSSIVRRVVNGISIVLAAACLAYVPATLAQEIKIGGTGNALGTMRLLGEAFQKKHPQIKVVVLSSMGSSGAVKAVPRGAIDIGLTSRALAANERVADEVSLEYARTPTVFAVPTKTKATAISVQQVADIYAGKLERWPDGTPIRPVLRQPGDDNTRQIRALSPLIEKALVAAEQRPGLAFAFTDQEAAEQIEKIPGALGVTTLALIRSEERSLRALSLEGVEPSVENTGNGKYPIIKNFFMIIKSAPSPAAQQFMAFVRAPEGRQILEQTGHWVP